MDRGMLLLGIAVGLAGAGIALAAGPGSLVGSIAGVAAVAVAGAVVVASLVPGLRWPARPMPVARVDPLGRLRGSMTPGSLGRERVVFAVQALEFGSGARSGPSFSPGELREILAWPSDRFLRWLEERLDHLEKET